MTHQHRARTPVRRTRRAAAPAVSLAVSLAAAVGASLVAASPAGAASDETWNRLAQCESSGDWHIDTGNGYYGGLQFSDQTWDGFGGERYASTADEATRAQQIAIAEKVLDVQGWGAWPACSAELGLDRADAAGDPTRSGGRAPIDRAGRSADGAYTVQAGDTLSRIAAEQGVSWRALWRVNADQISDPNVIFVGQVLDLP